MPPDFCFVTFFRKTIASRKASICLALSRTLTAIRLPSSLAILNPVIAPSTVHRSCSQACQTLFRLSFSALACPQYTHSVRQTIKHAADTYACWRILNPIARHPASQRVAHRRSRRGPAGPGPNDRIPKTTLPKNTQNRMI
jgi:hypothetical protein